MSDKTSNCQYCEIDPTQLFVCDYIRISLQLRGVSEKDISIHVRNVCSNPEGCNHYWAQLERDGGRIIQDLKIELSRDGR